MFYNLGITAYKKNKIVYLIHEKLYSTTMSNYHQALFSTNI